MIAGALLEADAHARPVRQAVHELVDQVLGVGAPGGLGRLRVLAGNGCNDLAMRLQELAADPLARACLS